MKKRVLLINTGGTIGMCQVGDRLQLVPGYLSDALAAMPEFKSSKLPDYELIEYNPLVDSCNITPTVWNQIAVDIQRHYMDFDGFIILHGTDTMSYTASALSFMLENLNKPVIITGAQLPLADVRSDARENIINSFYIANNYSLSEVCLCFHDKLLRGNRSTKASSTRYNAFESPNFPALASMEARVQFNSDVLHKKTEKDFTVCQIKSVNIAVIRLFPGMNAVYLQKMFEDDLRAIVVATYGMGNAPSSDQALMQVFQYAQQRGVIMVSCTQCQQGYVDMDTYQTGNQLAELGFVGAHDMTMEAVIGKLYYLLSKDLPLIDVKQAMTQNLRGELSLSA